MKPPKNWVFLIQVILLGSINQTQRYLLGYMVSVTNILGDTNTSNTEYGVLSGPAFLLVYSLVILPMGRLVDYLKKPKLFFLGICLACCACSAANVLATSFWGLLWPRALFALASAAVDPLSLRLMTLQFPPEKRGVASGCYFLVIYIGISAASALMLVGEYYGWRVCYLLIAGIGAVTTLLVGFFLDDIENFQMNTETYTTKQDIQELYKNKTLVFTISGLFFNYMCGFAKSFYEALYFIEAFPDKENTYAVLNSVCIILFPIGPIIGGKLSDIKEKENSRWRPLICCFTLLYPIPLYLVQYLSPYFWLAMVGTFLISPVGETYISVSYAIMINVTTPRVRGFQTAFMISSTFVAGSITTVVLGAADTSLENLRVALLVIVCFGRSLAALFFYLVSRVYPEDLERANSKSQILLED